MALRAAVSFPSIFADLAVAGLRHSICIDMLTLACALPIEQLLPHLPMGCKSSKQAEEEQAAIVEKKRQRDAANAAMNAPRVDPKDFMLVKLKDQTIVKEPGSAPRDAQSGRTAECAWRKRFSNACGCSVLHFLSSIRGQQFIIEECDNCTIYLLDYSATVSIDDCTNCRIFVGPCESSVFVRTSTNLKLVLAAQQLRTRDCRDLDILLYVSAGQPVIESTSNVRLGCFAFNYFGLAEQFVAAGLDPWYSEWSNVHDFTASAGSLAWSYMQPPLVKGTDLLPPLEQAKEGLEQLSGFVTPQTWGNRPLPCAAGSPRLLVLFAPGQQDAAFELLENDATVKGLLAEGQGAFLIRSRNVAALASSKELQNAVLLPEARKKHAGFMDALTNAATKIKGKGKGAHVLGLEIVVAQEHLPTVQSALESLANKVGAENLFVSGASEAESKGPLEAFFANAPIM